jgi:hypothetical protein
VRRLLASEEQIALLKRQMREHGQRLTDTKVMADSSMAVLVREGLATPYLEDYDLQRVVGSSKHSRTNEATEATRIIEATRNRLPDDLVSWRQFARLHGIPETTVDAAIKDTRIPAVRVRSRTDKSTTILALDATGRFEFYKRYSNSPSFRPCPECPHDMETKEPSNRSISSASSE